MKKSSFVFVTLTILISLFGVSCATSAQITNPHDAKWLDESMIASLDTLKRVDEEGFLYEMTWDYDYYGNPIFKTLLSKFGQYDAGCSAFTTWNETGDSFMTARNCDFKHTDSSGAYTGLNVVLHCAPEGKYKSLGIADAFWLAMAGGNICAGALDDGYTDTSLAVLLPYLIVDGINEKGLTVSIVNYSAIELPEHRGV